MSKSKNIHTRPEEMFIEVPLDPDHKLSCISHPERHMVFRTIKGPEEWNSEVPIYSKSQTNK